MTTFKDIHGSVIHEMIEETNSNDAIEFAKYFNSRNKRKIVEIDYGNGRIDFINN